MNRQGQIFVDWRVDAAYTIAREPHRLWLPEAERLRSKGMTMNQIAERVGHAPSTVSAYLPQSLIRLSNYDLAHLRRVACAPEDVLRVCAEATEQRRRMARDRQREAAEERQRQRAQRRYRWQKIPPARVSFDAETEASKLSEHIADPSILGRDPLLILTDDNPLEEILAGLDEADIARMDDHQLHRLRERILATGIAPTHVQQAERERLFEPVPHRGQAPPPKMGRKASRHRGRNEASALHKSKGKRFVRREKDKQRDGWGGVVLP